MQGAALNCRVVYDPRTSSTGQQTQTAAVYVHVLQEVFAVLPRTRCRHPAALAENLQSPRNRHLLVRGQQLNRSPVQSCWSGPISTSCLVITMLAVHRSLDCHGTAQALGVLIAV
jgi:hypothetical protein